MNILKNFKIFLVFFVIIFSLPLFAEDKNTCFILSRKIKPYIEMLNGFTEVSKYKTDVFDLSKDRIDDNSLKKCDVLVSAGTNANNFLKKEKISTLKIYTFFIYKNESNNYLSDNESFGIFLYPEPENLINFYIKNKIKKIFALYSEDKVGKYLTVAKEVFSNYNIKVTIKKINYFKDIDRIILNNEVENLWILPDKLYSSKNIIDYIITKAAIYNVKVIGFNRYFYDVGAKYSIVVDYRGIGKIIYNNILSEKLNINHLIHSPFDFKVAEKE